ncbi:hypothetical protein LCGC14_2914340 [marine sediment metagenome]|uniref:Uncharacterized protein n=1 Tax=marine sediment metagenome TaxID=412755 RepID=A0A0F9AGX6_9ZZZZ
MKITFKEFLLQESKKKKKKDAEKEFADHEHEKTYKSYRASNAIKSVGMGHGVN